MTLIKRSANRCLNDGISSQLLLKKSVSDSSSAIQKLGSYDPILKLESMEARGAVIRETDAHGETRLWTPSNTQGHNPLH